jgi:hypothetical protein
VWFRRLLSQLDDVTELLQALGRMLVEIDGKLERILEIVEGD